MAEKRFDVNRKEPKKSFPKILPNFEGLTDFYDSDFFKEHLLYEGTDLGVTFTEDHIQVKLWAPMASRVYFLLYKKATDAQDVARLPMERMAEGIFQLILPLSATHHFYLFELHHDHEVTYTPGPYANAVGVNGEKGYLLDLKETDPEGFRSYEAPQLEDPVDAIIYEVHVRDLTIHEDSGVTHKGTYLGFVEEGTKNKKGHSTGIDHIKELGVTHVQLLPIFDYDVLDETKPHDSYNWGYDPMHYNAPEGSYATDPTLPAKRIEELKKLIMGVHKKGMGVIMDVVYNHTYDGYGSSFHKSIPLYYHRSVQGRLTNASGCGNETASERAMMRKFIIDSLSFWVKEYRIDGFRFDLMGIHDVDTMREVELALRKLNPGIILYGEGWAGGDSPLHEDLRMVKRNINAVPGIGAFNDDFRDAVKGHVFFTERGGFVSGQDERDSVKFGIVGATRHDGIHYGQILYTDFPWAVKPSQSINYVSAHDNLTLYDKLKQSNRGASKEVLKSMAKLANTLVLTSQGVPFLHAGVEFLRTKQGDHNSYRSSDSINALDWHRKSRNIDVVNYYKGVIALRKEYDAFRLRTKEDIEKYLTFYDGERENRIVYTLKDPKGFYTLLVAFNGGSKDQSLPLPKATWDVLLDKNNAGILPLWRTTQDTITLKAHSALILMTRDQL